MVSDSQAKFAWQFVDAVLYAATVLWMAFVVAAVVGFSLGRGLIGAKYVLFFGGMLVAGVSLFFTRPKRGDEWVDEQVGAKSEDDDDTTRLSGLTGFFMDDDEIEDPDSDSHRHDVEPPDDVDVVEDPIELVPPYGLCRRFIEEDATFGARLLASGLLLIGAAWVLESVFGVGV